MTACHSRLLLRSRRRSVSMFPLGSAFGWPEFFQLPLDTQTASPSRTSTFMW